MSRLLKISSAVREKLVFGSMIATGVVSASLTFFPNTLFVEKYSSFFQLYRKGIPVDVSDESIELLQEVGEELELTIRNPPVELFSVIGFETLRFGSAWTRGGCFIGIPPNFEYEEPDDVDRNIMVDGKLVPWDSEDGKKFQESLILSRLAKKYIIARELCIAHTPIIYLHAIYPTIVVVFLAYFNNAVYNRANWHLRPPLMMRAFYVFLVVFGFGLYFMFKDMTTHYLEFRADDTLAKTSEEYLKGGKEYCDKIMLRNSALRNLFSSGKSDFATDGEELHLFRSKNLSLRQRKQIFEKQLAKLKDPEAL